MASGIVFGPVTNPITYDLEWQVDPLLVTLTGADLDGDGARERILAEGAEIHRITAFTSGAYSPGTVAATSWRLVASGQVTALLTADVDADGSEDLVVGTDEALLVVAGSSGGTLPADAKGNILGGVRALAAGDFDGDGDTDLAVGTATSEVLVYRAPLHSSSVPDAVWRGRPHPTDDFGFALDAAELDGDARDDLVVGAPNEFMPDSGHQRPGGYNLTPGRVYFLPSAGLK